MQFILSVSSCDACAFPGQEHEHGTNTTGKERILHLCWTIAISDTGNVNSMICTHFSKAQNDSKSESMHSPHSAACVCASVRAWLSVIVRAWMSDWSSRCHVMAYMGISIWRSPVKHVLKRTCRIGRSKFTCETFQTTDHIIASLWATLNISYNASWKHKIAKLCAKKMLPFFLKVLAH